MRSRSRRPNERRFAAATSTRAGTEIQPIQIPDVESLPRAGASDPRRGLALRRPRPMSTSVRRRSREPIGSAFKNACASRCHPMPLGGVDCPPVIVLAPDRSMLSYCSGAMPWPVEPQLLDRVRSRCSERPRGYVSSKSAPHFPRAPEPPDRADRTSGARESALVGGKGGATAPIGGGAGR